jgi:hypothetical protein
MFIDYIDSRHKKDHKAQYDYDVFLHNGGIPTLKSYLGDDWEGWRPSKASAILLDDIEWLRNRPTKLELDDVIVTHAPISRGDIKRFDRISTFDQVWNRDFIAPNEKFQFFGHNGHYREYVHMRSDILLPGEQVYAICVDDSRNNNLTAVNWPSLEKIRVKFK